MYLLAYVALFTRAWIEIRVMKTITSFHSVALFTRAWIEISYISGKFASQSSPSLRGRGLKYFNISFLSRSSMSPSLRGRGLKYKPRENFSVPLGRPLYEGVDWNKLSRKVIKWPCHVALFTRAWIEIVCLLSLTVFPTSPSLRGRGLK